MNGLTLVLAAFMLANLLAALVRIVRGPTAADRLLVALLFGTTGVAVLLLLAHAQNAPALVDVALLFALLAVITVAAFTGRAWRGEGEGQGEGQGEGHGNDRHR